MSNRFHTKWHRKNHHTYGNPNNPDASFDPIASPAQPFLGDFSIQGAISAVAPASGYGVYIFTNFTALCAFAGTRAGYFYSYGPMGVEIYDSTSRAISAFAPRIGLDIASNMRAISAFGGNIAGEFYSPQYAISAYGRIVGAGLASNMRAISAYGGNIAGEFYSPQYAISAYGGIFGASLTSPIRALSAYGGSIGIEVGSPLRALSAYGGSIGIEVGSPMRALSALGGVVGIDVGSPMRALSAYGGSIGIQVGSANTALSAFGNRIALYTTGGVGDPYPNSSTPYAGPNYISKNVLNNRTGIFTENPLSAFHVTGGTLLDGHCTITGNLSVAGDLTRLDTYVYITSSVEINVQNNSNSTPALFVSNKGNNKIIAAYDGDVTNPALIVDGDSSRPGNIGLGVLNPATRLQIYNSGTGTPPSLTNASGTVVHVAQADATNNRLLLDSFGAVSVARPSFTGRHANGTAASSTAVQTDDVICEFTGMGYGTSGYSTTSRSRLTMRAAENWTDSAQGTYVTVETTAVNGTTTSEKVRIDNAGNLGIGVTPTTKLDVNGGVKTNGAIQANTSTNAQVQINTGSGNASTDINTTANASALGLGNASGNTNIAAAALDITSAGNVTINATTGRTTNINTGTGGVTTTIGNNTASNVTTINSQSVTAPNQTYVDGTSVITGSLADSRYGNYLNNRTAGSANTTTSFNTTNLVVGSVTLAANTTYQIEAVAVLSTSTTGGSKVTFAGDGALVFSVISIQEFSYSSASTTCVGATYVGSPASTTITANTTTRTSAGAETHTYRRSGFITTGATGGVLYFQHAGNSAGNTTPQTGSYLIARRIV